MVRSSLSQGDQRVEHSSQLPHDHDVVRERQLQCPCTPADVVETGSQQVGAVRGLKPDLRRGKDEPQIEHSTQ